DAGRRLREGDVERAGGGSARSVGHGEGEAVVVVAAVLAVAHLVGVDIILREGAVDRQGVAAQLQGAVGRRRRHRVDKLAGRVAGFAAGREGAAGNRSRRVLAQAQAGVGADAGGGLGEGNVERAGRGRAGSVGDGKGEAV